MTDFDVTAVPTNPVHAAILHDYFEEGVGLHLLSAKYGRSVLQIRRLTKPYINAGRQRKTNPQDRRQCYGAAPLTKMHKRIGMAIYRWRDQQQKLTSTQAAIALGLSANRLSTIEAGAYNWTFLELMYVTERMGTDVMSFLKSIDLASTPTSVTA